MGLGCPKCRYSRGGCKRCRDITFVPTASTLRERELIAQGVRARGSKKENQMQMGHARAAEPGLQARDSVLEGAAGCDDHHEVATPLYVPHPAATGAGDGETSRKSLIEQVAVRSYVVGPAASKGAAALEDLRTLAAAQGRLVSATMSCTVMEVGGSVTVTFRDGAASGPAEPTSLQDLLHRLPLDPQPAIPDASVLPHEANGGITSMDIDDSTSQPLEQPRPFAASDSYATVMSDDVTVLSDNDKGSSEAAAATVGNIQLNFPPNTADHVQVKPLQPAAIELRASRHYQLSNDSILSSQPSATAGATVVGENDAIPAKSSISGHVKRHGPPLRDTMAAIPAASTPLVLEAVSQAGECDHPAGKDANMVAADVEVALPSEPQITAAAPFVVRRQLRRRVKSQAVGVQQSASMGQGLQKSQAVLAGKMPALGVKSPPTHQPSQPARQAPVDRHLATAVEEAGPSGERLSPTSASTSGMGPMPAGTITSSTDRGTHRKRCTEFAPSGGVNAKQKKPLALRALPIGNYGSLAREAGGAPSQGGGSNEGTGRQARGHDGLYVRDLRSILAAATATATNSADSPDHNVSASIKRLGHDIGGSSSSDSSSSNTGSSTSKSSGFGLGVSCSSDGVESADQETAAEVNAGRISGGPMTRRGAAQFQRVDYVRQKAEDRDSQGGSCGGVSGARQGPLPQPTGRMKRVASIPSAAAPRHALLRVTGGRRSRAGRFYPGVEEVATLDGDECTEQRGHDIGEGNSSQVDERRGCHQEEVTSRHHNADMAVSQLSPRCHCRNGFLLLSPSVTLSSTPLDNSASSDFLSRLQANMESRKAAKAKGGPSIKTSPLAPSRRRPCSSGRLLVKGDPRVATWEPPASPYGLLEEQLYEDPWRVLVACLLLNKTSATMVRRVIWRLFRHFPGAAAVAEADVAAIGAIVDCLGLQGTRAATLRKFSRDYLSKEWLNPQELHGVGKYGADAYFMFCRHDTWRLLQPTDKDLVRYWLFLKDTDGEGMGLTRDLVPVCDE